MTAIVCLGQSFSSKKRFTSLKLRVEKSVKLYKEGKGSKLIFTGGFTITADISEAQLMSDIARALGVPSKDIILEEKAITTVGNAICTKRIIEMHGFNSLIYCYFASSHSKSQVSFSENHIRSRNGICKIRYSSKVPKINSPPIPRSL